MKVRCVRFYQAVPIGTKLEHYLQVGPTPNHPGLTLEWANGLLKIEANALKLPRSVPAANIMFMDFEPEASSQKGDTAEAKPAKVK